MAIKNPCKNIKDTRKKLGMNQTMFWNKFGLTQSTGCRYENGRNIPVPIKMLIEVAVGSDGDKTVARLRGA